jgi:hypothetical protein
MNKYDEWPRTKKVLVIDGICRPKVTKQIMAVAIAKYVPELTGYKRCVETVAPFINAVGNIHGPTSKVDVPGYRYAAFAIKLLSGKTDSHIKYKPAKVWLKERESNIEGCFDFIEVLVDKFKDVPPHTPYSTYNQHLIEQHSVIVE